MARINTKNFALFMVSGASLPTPPANFIEMSEKLMLTPEFTSTQFKRYNGKLGANDSYTDTEDTKNEGKTITHMMRTSDKAGTSLATPPQYAELLKIGGFTETIDTGTPGQETVTYDWNKNSSPALASAVYYMDGNKQTLTNTIAMNIAFDFTVGTAAMITGTLSGYLDNKGVATSEANPTVTLSEESVIVCASADVYTENGGVIKAGSVQIDMGAEISNFRGFNDLQEYETTDFAPTITSTFPVETGAYNDATNLIINDTKFDVVIKLATDAGTEVNGKTVVFTITNVKMTTFTDADDQDSLSRSHNMILTDDSTFSIKHGFYA